MNYGRRFMTLYRRQASRPSPRKRNAKRHFCLFVRGLFVRGLTNSCEKKRSEKQGEKERYKHMNAEFQRISRRDKKTFSDQCKEIEENNRVGKTRDLFKKIRNTKGMFHAQMGSIKDRNCMDITEVEDIKRRWQEYTEKLYKKDLHDPDDHDSLITHLEPDILECEVKWKHHYEQSYWR